MPTFTTGQRVMITAVNIGVLFAVCPFTMALTVLALQAVLGFCLGVGLALLGLVKPG